MIFIQLQNENIKNLAATCAPRHLALTHATIRTLFFLTVCVFCFCHLCFSVFFEQKNKGWKSFKYKT